jgi:tRNA/tmRNA/rRNA uracil-C5-methylase (TrmA/RlmC/RlmD family)
MRHERRRVAATMSRPQRGQELELKIDALAFGGEGIARWGASGYVVFVAGAIPGDTVRAVVYKPKRTYAHARTLEVLQPGPERIEPRAAHPGVPWQVLPYERQLQIKQQQVADALRRLARLEDFTLEPIVPALAQWRYRNKLEYSFGADPDSGELICGFHAPAGRNRVIAIEDCLLASELGNRARDTAAVWARAQALEAWSRGGEADALSHDGETEASSPGGQAAVVSRDGEADASSPGGATGRSSRGRESPARRRNGTPDPEATARIGPAADGRARLRNLVVREGRHTGKLQVRLVSTPGELDVQALAQALHEALGEHLSSLLWTRSSQLAETTLGGETELVAGEAELPERLGELDLRIAHEAFFQTNTEMTEVLYGIVAEYAALEGWERVFDLYCGIGTIGLTLAPRAGELWGIELVEEAVANAIAAAARNEIHNVHFFAGDTRLALPELLAKAGRPDVLVVDPPRAGLSGKVVRRIIDTAPKRIVYVSCNPTTLAPNAAQLVEAGWALRKVRPVDMFPQTHHVECVALFERR